MKRAVRNHGFFCTSRCRQPRKEKVLHLPEAALEHQEQAKAQLHQQQGGKEPEQIQTAGRIEYPGKQSGAGPKKLQHIYPP